MPYGDDELLSLRALAAELPKAINFDKLHRAVTNYGPGSSHPVPVPDDVVRLHGRSNYLYTRRRIPEWRRWFAEHADHRKPPGPSKTDFINYGPSAQARLVGEIQHRADDLAGTLATLRRALADDEEIERVFRPLDDLAASSDLAAAVVDWMESTAVQVRWWRWPPAVRKEPRPSRARGGVKTRTLTLEGRKKVVAQRLCQYRFPRQLAAIKETLERIEHFLATQQAHRIDLTRQAFIAAIQTYAPEPNRERVPRLLPPLKQKRKRGPDG